MVSLKYLGAEFETVMDEIDFWFDRETEQVVFVDTYNHHIDDDEDEDDDENQNEIYLINKNLNKLIKNNPDRFVQLPSKYEFHDWHIMADFVDEQTTGDRNELLWDAIHGKGASRMFTNLVERWDLLDDWYALKAAAYREKAREWCEENDIEYTE